MSGSETTATRRRGLKWLVAACALIVAGAVGGLILLHCRRAYREPEKVFDGDSTALQRTVIVPTLHTPIPPGKNVIWCASFQVAWNRLKDDVIKEPIRIENAEEVCERLNRAPQSSSARLQPPLPHRGAKARRRAPLLRHVGGQRRASVQAVSLQAALLPLRPVRREYVVVGEPGDHGR